MYKLLPLYEQSTFGKFYNYRDSQHLQERAQNTGHPPTLMNLNGFLNTLQEFPDNVASRPGKLLLPYRMEMDRAIDTNIPVTHFLPDRGAQRMNLREMK